MSVDDPLVSVFIPAYNQEKYVGPAIDSVLSQDYENLEIALGDDCSTDHTWDIILEYQARFPSKIRAYRNERNLGITENCKALLKECTGEYIAFYAGDDLFLPGKIRKQVDVMKRDQTVVLCYHDIEVFDSDTNATLYYWNRGPNSAAPIVGSAHEVARAVVAHGTTFMAPLSVMARTDAVQASAYDRRLPVSSDWLMWIEILANARPEAKVVFLDEVLARYRRHETNVTNSFDKCYPDVLVTLALVECKHPWLIDEVAHAQARFRYSNGIRLICDGEFALGRDYLIQSAKTRLFSWKWLAWFTASYIPAIRPKRSRRGPR